jgi:hypothetical protein
MHGILEQPGAGARVSDRGSNHASALFDEATASDFAAIEPATQGMSVRRIDHDGIVLVAARRRSPEMRGPSGLTPAT